MLSVDEQLFSCITFHILIVELAIHSNQLPSFHHMYMETHLKCFSNLFFLNSCYRNGFVGKLNDMGEKRKKKFSVYIHKKQRQQHE